MATKKEKEAVDKAAAEEAAAQEAAAEDAANKEAQEALALEMLLEASSKEPVDNRLIALFGDIDEAKAGQLCYNLHVLSRDKRFSAKNPKDLTEGLTEVVDPIELMICSPGGNASEMFPVASIMSRTRLMRSAGCRNNILRCWQRRVSFPEPN